MLSLISAPRRLALTTALVTSLAPFSAVAAPNVAASIAPIHSIVSAIMKDVGKPDLLVEQSSSPHSTKLRPSSAKALQNADLVVWVGPDLEPFLIKPIENLSEGAKTLSLVEAQGVSLLPVREGANWEKHSHEGEEHEHEHAEDHDHDHDKDHDDHDHAEDHDHEHEHDGDHEEGHEHEEHHDHDDDHADMHLWLDPQNGIAMAKSIAAELSAIDPENASSYAANQKAFIEKLEKVQSEASKTLAPVKDKPFIVFHDAYHYLENRFGLSAVGSVTLHPGVAPGAARVSEIKQKLKDLGATCIFSEPQFSGSILPVLIEGTDTKLGELDPLGQSLTVGPDLYPDLIAMNAKALGDCLSD